METRNAKIISVSLGKEDHGCLTVWLNLDFGAAKQSFGGYALDVWDETKKKRVGTAYGLNFIMAILETLEVDRWEKLPGTCVRVRGNVLKIESIGHFLKEKWFDPKTLTN